MPPLSVFLNYSESTNKESIVTHESSLRRPLHWRSPDKGLAGFKDIKNQKEHPDLDSLSLRQRKSPYATERILLRAIFPIANTQLWGGTALGHCMG